MKLADAEIKVNLAMKQYDISNEAYKNQLSVFNSLLSAGGLTNATGEDIASYAVATGIPTSLIQGIADKQKQEAIKPQVFDNTDDNGNVTLSIVDVNTGNIINTTSLGKVVFIIFPVFTSTMDNVTFPLSSVLSNTWGLIASCFCLSAIP